MLALLAISLAVLGAPRDLPRPLVAALALLAALTLWAYLSIIWASQPGPAWEGANRTCLYLLLFALFSLWSVGAGGARVVLGVVGLGLAALGLVELLRMAGAADPSGFFIGARLAEPAGYINANAALWTVGLLPCLCLACRPELPPPLRGLLLGGAGLLAGLALMSQSRGWLLTAPLAALILLALAPGRLRLLGALALVAGAMAAVAGPLLAVHDDFQPGKLGALVNDAAPPLLLAVAGLALAGLVWGLAERRVRPGPMLTRRLGLAVAALAALAVTGSLVALAAADTGPADRVSKLWRDFKRGGEAPKAGGARLSAVATNRYDFWRVGWQLAREQPLHGIGAENFQEEYLRRGRSPEQARYAHSLELGTVSQLGFPGLLLLLGALAAAVAAALRARASAAALPVAACLGTFSYWLLHASIDWLWEVPAVTGVAVALLALAAGSAPRSEAPPRPLRRALGPAALLAALIVCASMALPWLAELEVRKAARSWPLDPAGAQSRLERAERLNPLSPRAQLTSATISLRRGRTGAAARSFRAALEREPRNFYAVFELGLIAAERGQRGLALAHLRRALALSPRDSFAQEALAAVREGRRLSVSSVNRAILQRARLFTR